MSADIEVEQVWQSIANSLLADVSVTSSLGGFIALAKPRGVMAGTLYLEVPNDYTRTMLENRLRPAILQAISKTDDAATVINFAVVVNPEIESELVQSVSEAEESVSDAAVSESVQQRETQLFDESRLNPKYSFDNFVIGGSNRFAHAAAVAVAEAPAKAYNPLFIYGESGLGKTHLLHAIGHYAQVLYPGIRVRYVSSEEFTNDFINSIANNQGTQFHNRYRNIDILLVDDIQFLQGKAETQEAFFHTFNTLHDHSKQVVITSDLPPKHLTGFEDRMRSRFEWGLITDIQVPDLETRIAILRKKAQSDQLQVSDDILEFIASKVSANIRELEGTLIRVTAFASLNNQVVDMPLVQTVLRDVIMLDADNEISPTEIINQTADYFNVGVDELYGSSRSASLANARQIAMYLCRDLTSLSLPKIGQLFGGRDHTTVMYAHKKIAQLMTERRAVYNQITELTNRIKQTSNRY